MPTAPKLVLASCLTSVLACTQAFAANSAPKATESQANLVAFAKAEPGMERVVIHLPARSKATHVELVIGQNRQVDCNHHRLGGAMEEKVAEGWGFTYYRYEAKPGVSTKMACIGQAPRQAWVQGPQWMVPYNARLPLVVYVTQGHEVRYRLMTPGPYITAKPQP